MREMGDRLGVNRVQIRGASLHPAVLRHVAFRCIYSAAFDELVTHSTDTDSSGAPHEFMIDFGPHRRSTVRACDALAAPSVTFQQSLPSPRAIAVSETSSGPWSPSD